MRKICKNCQLRNGGCDYTLGFIYLSNEIMAEIRSRTDEYCPHFKEKNKKGGIINERA